MNPLIVDNFGVNLSVEKFCLNIKSRDTQLYRFAPHEIPYDSIMISSPFGSVSIEAQKWCAKHSISIMNMTQNGKMWSQTIPILYQNVGALRIAQVRTHDEPLKRFLFAKSVICAKVRKPIPVWVKTLRQLKTFEGIEAEKYWNNFGERVNEVSKGKFEFTSRMAEGAKYNYNATSKINALLNFGFSGFLEGIVRKNVISVGLMPEIGFVHEVNKGKEPLVYDIQDTGFREIISEKILNTLPQIKQSDFEYDRKNYQLRLKPVLARFLLETFSETFEEKRQYKGASWRTEPILTAQGVNESRRNLNRQTLMLKLRRY